MKNVFLWLLLVLVFVPISAIPQAVICDERNNTVYIGLDNPISVAVPGYSSKSVFATIDSGGTWKLDKPGHYILRPDGSKQLIKVTVYVKTFFGKKREIGNMNFLVKSFPSPVMLLGIYEPGNISKSELNLVKFVQANMGDICIEGVSPSILKTQIMIISADTIKTNPQLKEFKGRLIPDDILNDLRNTNTGDKIYIFCKIKDIEGQYKNLTSVYEVK